MVWGPIIAWYLFLAGISAGAFIATSYLDRRFPGMKKVSLIGRVFALVAIGVGLVLLMVDARAGLSNPLRFFYLVTNANSVMTLGVYAICLYLIVLVAALVLDVLKRAIPKALTAFGCAFAVCVAAYTGFLLGVATPYPLWNNAALPVLFVVSGISGGLAAVCLIARFVDRAALERVGLFERAGVVLPIVEAFVLFCMLVIVHSSSSVGSASVAALLTGGSAPIFWIALVALGIVMPLVLEAYAAISHRHNVVAGSVSNAGVLVGGFALRYLVITAAIVTLCV